MLWNYLRRQTGTEAIAFPDLLNTDCPGDVALAGNLSGGLFVRWH